MYSGSRLIINFANQAFRPGKEELWIVMRRIMALRKRLDCEVVFHYIVYCDNKGADWLNNVAQVLKADWEPSKLAIRLGNGVPYPAE